MASATVTTYDAVIRELWPDQRVNNLVLEDSAFLGLVPKDETFHEKNRHIAMQFANPQGRSGTFSDAQGNATSSQFSDFSITRIVDYATGTIDGELIESTQAPGGNKAALVDGMEREMKSALEELNRSTAKNSWGTGSGTRGEVATSGITTTALTLAETTDVSNFEVNMEIVAAATETGAIRSGSATITAIDRTDGILTTDSNWTAQITGITDADFLFVEGDAPNGGASKMLSGVPAWVPTADPGATAFFGVDRTTDVVRQGGLRYDGSGDGSIKEAIQRGAHRGRQLAGRALKLSHCFMNPEDVGNLVIELGSDVEYERFKASEVKVKRPNGSMGTQRADVGFDAVMFWTAAGRFPIFAETWVDRGFVWALELQTWRLATLGPMVQIIRHDGLRVARQAASDGVEYRARMRGQVYTDAPGWNLNVQIPT
jgi:hypothetical protein